MAQSPQRPSLFDLRKDTARVNLIIVLCHYSFVGDQAHERHEMPKRFKNKKQSNFRETYRSTV